MSRALSKLHLDTFVKFITKLYPKEYSDASWDNTGLLIDCSVNESNLKMKVLLTIDLTSSVAQEAIDKECNLILAYHPFIFPSWKNLSPASNSQHKSAINLIQHGISVYCPHTAVDAAKNGVNDWLVSTLVHNQSMIKSVVSIEPITPLQNESKNEIGYGRIVEFTEPVYLNQIINQVKQRLNIPYVQVATKKKLNDYAVQKVALCAGSGSSVFKSLKEDVDLYYTGELSHHEILRYTEASKAVITCNHTNTERGYLREVMCELLTKRGFECLISEFDADPLKVV